MNDSRTEIARAITRMLHTSQDTAEGLTGSVRRIVIELSALSTNFRAHMARAGVLSADLLELDGGLAETTGILRQTRDDLERRVLGGVRELRQINKLAQDPGADNDRRTLADRLREQLHAYDEALKFEYFTIGELLARLSFGLRIIANNIEIAASHAGTSTGSAPVELFCLIGSQLRGLANRLRTATADLQIFQQTQKGHAESVRQALRASEGGAVA